MRVRLPLAPPLLGRYTMFLYLKFVFGLAVTILLFGFITPFYVSATSDETLIIAYALIALYFPFMYLLFAKQIKQLINLDDES